MIVTRVFSFVFYVLSPLLKNRRDEMGGKVQRLMTCFIVLLMHPFFSSAYKKRWNSERAGPYVTPYTLENIPSAMCKVKLSLILVSALTHEDIHLSDVSTNCIEFCFPPGALQDWIQLRGGGCEQLGWVQWRSLRAEEDVKMFEGGETIGGEFGLCQITATAAAGAGHGGKLPCSH